MAFLKFNLIRMKDETYIIHICGPWRPSEVSIQSAKLLGYDIENNDAIFRLNNLDWMTVFYRNNIVLGAMVYGRIYD